LRFANVDARDVVCVAGVNAPLYEDSLCLCADGALSLGRVDRVQRLHVRSMHRIITVLWSVVLTTVCVAHALYETPRRIVHLARAKLVAVLTSRAAVPSADLRRSMVRHMLFVCCSETLAHFTFSQFIRLFDADTFELLDSIELKSGETGISMIEVQGGGRGGGGDSDAMVDDDDDDDNNNNGNGGNGDGAQNGTSCIVIGTALPLPDDVVDASRGRMLLLTVRERRLVQLAEVTTAGAVYSLGLLPGNAFAAGVNSSVTVWRWRVPASDAADDLANALRMTATKVCLFVRSLITSVVLTRAFWRQAGHTLVGQMSTRGNTIAVGDLWQSITLWRVEKAVGGKDALQLVARDPQPNWMMAIEVRRYDE
jgi:hypothetical protein